MQVLEIWQQPNVVGSAASVSICSASHKFRLWKPLDDQIKRQLDKRFWIQIGEQLEDPLAVQIDRQFSVRLQDELSKKPT